MPCGCSDIDDSSLAEYGNNTYIVTDAEVCRYAYGTFMMGGLTLDAVMNDTASEGVILGIGLELPGKTYEFPEGTYVLGEDPVFLGAVFDVVSEAGSDSQEITKCTMTIGRSGKNYTFRISGETEDGQPVSCRYTGPVQFVDFDSMM